LKVIKTKGPILAPHNSRDRKLFEECKLDYMVLFDAKYNIRKYNKFYRTK